MKLQLAFYLLQGSFRKYFFTIYFRIFFLFLYSVSDPLRKYVGRKFDDIDYIDGRAVSIDHENKTVTYEGLFFFYF